MRKTLVHLLIVLSFAGACKKSNNAPAKYVRFEKPEITISNNPGEKDSITIESNTDWELSVTGTAKDAVQLSMMSGNGNARVAIALTEQVGEAHGATLVLSAKGGQAPTANCNIDIHTYSFELPWSKTFGGPGYDEINQISNLSPDEYILSGFSSSTNIDVPHNYGSDEGLALILNTGGAVTGLRKTGGSGLDQLLSVVPSGDGGYIVAGYTTSNNHEVVGQHGNADVWIVKMSSTHDTVWTRTWGGSLNDYATTIVVASDGNFLIGGMTNSDDGDFTNRRGGTDNWVMKINANGQRLWQNFLRMGGSGYEDLRGMVATGDGGCVVAGYSFSADIIGTTNSGSKDAYVAKLNIGGAIEWQRLIGGSNDDGIHAMAGYPDGSVVLAGTTSSAQGHETYQGESDGWLVKLDNTGAVIWDKCFGTVNLESFETVIATADGGCIAGGMAYFNGRDVSETRGESDGWLVKVNGLGLKVWHKVLGGTNADRIKAIAQMSNGDLIFAGTTFSNDFDLGDPLKGSQDIWLGRLQVK